MERRSEEWSRERVDMDGRHEPVCQRFRSWYFLPSAGVDIVRLDLHIPTRISEKASRVFLFPKTIIFELTRPMMVRSKRITLSIWDE